MKEGIINKFEIITKEKTVPVEVISGIIREAEMVNDILENSRIEAF